MIKERANRNYNPNAFRARAALAPKFCDGCRLAPPCVGIWPPPAENAEAERLKPPLPR